jgi:hypothetical protein
MRKQLYWLSDDDWAQIEPLLPRGRRGARRVDDRRVISGIMHMPAFGCPLARLSARVRALHDGLQPLRALGGEGRVGGCLHPSCRGRRPAGCADDRCYPCEGAPLGRRRKRMARPGASDDWVRALSSLHKRIRHVGDGRCQDGDPRVPILIKGPASRAILRRRLSGHRSTVRPSSSHHSQFVAPGGVFCRTRVSMCFRPPSLA